MAALYEMRRSGHTGLESFRILINTVQKGWIFALPEKLISLLNSVNVR